MAIGKPSRSPHSQQPQRDELINYHVKYTHTPGCVLPWDRASHVCVCVNCRRGQTEIGDERHEKCEFELACSKLQFLKSWSKLRLVKVKPIDMTIEIILPRVDRSCSLATILFQSNQFTLCYTILACTLCTPKFPFLGSFVGALFFFVCVLFRIALTFHHSRNEETASKSGRQDAIRGATQLHTVTVNRMRHLIALCGGATAATATQSSRSIVRTRSRPALGSNFRPLLITN